MEQEIILREKLAIQRTKLANQSTFLSFLRTSLYFLIAGLSIDSLIPSNNGFVYRTILFSTSIILFITGILNFLSQKYTIRKSEIQVGGAIQKIE